MSVVMAFILYLDRICMSEIVKSEVFQTDVALTKEQTGRVLGVFFFAYALFQVPVGFLSDRFDARVMLTLYIALWSAFTALTGMVSSFAALMVMRLLCGAAEAGAYPTCGALIRRWMPLSARARASSCVTVGGRAGGTLAPFITAWMVLGLGHWRPVLWIDGAVGLLVAALYWHFVRSRPSEHAGCNDAERTLIGCALDEPRLSGREVGGVLRAFLLSRNLWRVAAVLFLVNLGWAFLITWLPSYLKETKHVPALAGGRMVTLVLAAGMIGQIVGGWLSDASRYRFGSRWGRAIPLSLSGTLGAAGYVACLFVESSWGVVACCGAVSFAVDLGGPAAWACFQDLGGRITAVTFGWANMWGNLGASLIATIVPWLLAVGGAGDAGPRLVFLVCAAALFLSGVIALGIDSTKPILLPITVLKRAIPLT